MHIARRFGRGTLGVFCLLGCSLNTKVQLGEGAVGGTAMEWAGGSQGGAVAGDGGSKNTAGATGLPAGAPAAMGGDLIVGHAGGAGSAASMGGSSPGVAGAVGSPATTAGCGKIDWPTTNDQAGGTPYTLDIDGTTRQYYVSLPGAYDPSQPTRVVFAWHWLTATARSVIGGGFGGSYYGLKTRMPNAIYIAAEGLGDNGQTGWANTGGRDVAFLRAMLQWLDENYCVDKSRIFSVGFSYGGIMSNALACQLGGTFRAIAPFAGSMFGRANACVNQPVAAHITHGSADETLNISGGIAARDYLIAANHCTTTTVPIDPAPCVAYQGCDAGYPVIWCEHPGGHTVPSFATPAVATFFQQF